MTLLSVSHHVNLANAYSRLNEKNGVEPTFFFGASLCNFAIGGQYRGPSGTLTFQRHCPAQLAGPTGYSF